MVRYESDWQHTCEKDPKKESKMTTRIIDSGISIKHASNWTVSEAMREIIQNWLDVKHEFGCSGQLNYNSNLGYAFIHDSGPGLKIEHFAFGNNDKAEDSIGQFGEGFKSAFITLLRNNRTIDIRSNGLLIKPFFKISENFNTETLHYEIIEMKTISKGTNIRITCTAEEFENGKSYFSKLSVKFNWVEKDRMSLPGGTIYVNGSKVGNINKALYSYHFTRLEAGHFINRDRDAVDLNKVNPYIEYILEHLSSRKAAAVILKAFLQGTNCYEDTLVLRSPESNRAWHSTFVNLFGKKVLLSSGIEKDANAVYRGYRIIEGAGWNLGGFLKSIGVKSADDVFKEIAIKKTSSHSVKVSELTREEVSNLRWAKKMVAKYYSDPGNVAVSKDLEKLTGNVEGTVQGCFVRKTNKIFILRAALSDRIKTLEVLLHETVHKVSGATDISAEFEQALLSVSVGIIQMVEA
jgi:hypothetical protein